MLKSFRLIRLSGHSWLRGLEPPHVWLRVVLSASDSQLEQWKTSGLLHLSAWLMYINERQQAWTHLSNEPCMSVFLTDKHDWFNTSASREGLSLHQWRMAHFWATSKSGHCLYICITLQSSRLSGLITHFLKCFILHYTHIHIYCTDFMACPGILYTESDT